MKTILNWKLYRRRLKYWLDHNKRQRLLREEMEFHIESATQDFAAQGMPEEEARFAVRRRFGNMTRTSEDARFTWIAHWISDLDEDLHYLLCDIRRHAGFTTFTILIVGLGIGASSTLFQRRERSAAAASAVSRSGASGMD